jgi:hypothetical protein
MKFYKVKLTILNISYIFLLLFCTITLVNCQLLKSSTEKIKSLSSCKFDLVKVDKKVSFTEKTSNLWNYVIKLNIEAINPSNENITIGSYKLALFANDKWLSNIITEEPIRLTPNDTSIIIAKTIISPSVVLSVFWKNLMNEKIEYKINGTFYLKLGEFSYPFELTLLRVVENEN